MTAAPRKSWLNLALALAVALPGPAGAVERKVPTNGALPSVPRLALPAIPQAPKLDAALPPSLGVNQPAAAAPKISLPGVAPAAQPAAPNVQVPGAAPRTGEILQQLSPENAASVSDEKAGELAERLIDPSSLTADGAQSVDGSNAFPQASLSLAPWQRGGAWRGSRLVPTDTLRGAARDAKPSLSDRAHYGRLWVENLYFYIYTNIVNKWGPYHAYWKKMRDSGTPAPVSKPRKFFAHMRVFGQTGRFYVPGFAPLKDEKVISEALETFDTYFDAPYIGKRERDAFEGFVLRASVYNKERRAASKFRATVRDNLLKASTMPQEKIAPFFDALPTVEKTAEFQSKDADAILEKMKQVLIEEVAKEPKDAKDRVTGVILIGSFALGAATPKSDFDLEPLTADGGSGRVRDFAARVQKRWEELGRQTINPVSFHYFGYLESRWEIRAIHHEPYLIVSPDASLVERLSMRPGEPPSHVPSTELTTWGRFLRWAQFAAVYLVSLTVRAPK